MDLSSAIPVVKGLSTKIPGVKEICDKWDLCYYCKLQHPGHKAKECLNTGKGKTSFRFADLQGKAADTDGNDGDTLIRLEKV